MDLPSGESKNKQEQKQQQQSSRYMEHKDTNHHQWEQICLGDKSSKVLKRKNKRKWNTNKNVPRWNKKKTDTENFMLLPQT